MHIVEMGTYAGRLHMGKSCRSLIARRYRFHGVALYRHTVVRHRRPVTSQLLNDSKLGILAGSLLAGILGWAALHLTLPREADCEAGQ